MTLPEPLRSWLFVPATQPDRIHKALSSAADVVIVDLEDSVPDARKDEARASLAAWAVPMPKPLWVRVNHRTTAWHEQDVQAARELPGVQGILLPKVESDVDVPSATALAKPVGRSLQVGVLVESALGVMTLFETLRASPQVAMVMFGGAENADLMNDLQCQWSHGGLALQHARQHTLLAARAFPDVLLVDGVYARLDDAEGLLADTQLSRSLGYRARAAVHPKQIAPINGAYALTDAEIQVAVKLIEGFELALAEGRAATRVDDKLVDVAMYKAARRTLGRQ